MTVAKHTPGPWRPFIENAVVAVMKVGTRKEVVKWTGFDGSDFPNDVEANARLIAAAPALLAALQGVLRVADRKTDEFDAARAAIASATGEDR